MLQLQVATELRSIDQSRQQGEEQFHPSVTNITTVVELYNNYSLVTLTHQVRCNSLYVHWKSVQSWNHSIYFFLSGVQSLNWTTGLLDSPKLPQNTSFSTGQKLNVLTHSVTLLNCFLACSSIFPGVSRGQLVTCTFNKLQFWWLWLNPDELTTTNKL